MHSRSIATVIASALALALLATPGPAAAAVAAAGTFRPLAPTRLLDTRSATPVPANGVVAVPVVGVAGIPATGVAAVALTVTVTRAHAGGFVSAYPDGATRPTASNLNFLAGQTVPNLVITPVGSDGKVALFNGSTGPADLIADIAGYYTSGAPSVAGSFGALTPGRVLDTRHGLGAPTSPVAGGGAISVPVTGLAGVPTSGVSAVAINVTVTQPRAAGYLTAYADGADRPRASNLNFVAGQTIANLVIAPVGADGKIALANGSAGTVQIVGDVLGYYRSGAPSATGAFGPVAPARVLDSRFGIGVAAAPIAAGRAVQFAVTGVAGVPTSGVSAVAVNVTVTQAHGGGYITGFADGTPHPRASNLNFVVGQTVANLVIAPVGLDGKVSLFNGSGSTVSLIADVSGYYVGAPAPETVAPDPVSSLIVTPSTSSTALTWGNPGGDYTGVTIRRAEGTVAPATPDAGTLVADVPAPEQAYTDTTLTPNLTYSYALFAHGRVQDYAAPATRTVSLITTQAITGTVTAAATQAGLGGATVTATPDADLPAITATTDSSGHYALTGLKADQDYTVCVDPIGIKEQPAGGYVPRCWSSPTDPVSLSDYLFTAAGSTRSDIDMAVVVGGAITGRVTDRAGHPVSGVGISDDVRHPARTHTDGNGRYTLTGVAAGRAPVCFIASTLTPRAGISGYIDQCYNGQEQELSTLYDTVPVTVGRTTDGVDAKLDEVSTVRGRILGPDGTPVPGATVTVYDSNGYAVGSPSTSGTDGSYSVAIDLTFQGGSVCASATLGIRCAELDYAGRSNFYSPTTDLTVGLPRVGVTVIGTVTDSAGQPLKGVAVSTSLGGDANAPDHNPTAVTGADGTYRLAGASYVGGEGLTMCFDPGELVTPAAPAGFLRGCHDVDTSAGGTISGVDEQLSAAAGVTGAVTDQAGHPLAGVTVEVVDSECCNFATTDSRGNYSLIGLPPSPTYQVRFEVSGGWNLNSTTYYGGTSPTGYLDQCYNTVGFDGTCTKVALTAGHVSTGISARLLAGGEISGTVTDPAGHPLRHVRVDVFRGGFDDYEETDINGHWSAIRLATDDFGICYSGDLLTEPAAGGYAYQCADGVQYGADHYPVLVKAGATVNVTATLQANPVGTITGVVSDDAGHPLGGQLVYAQGSSETLSAADGSYTLSAVLAGDHEVCAVPQQTSTSSATGNLEACYSSGGAVTVHGGQVTPNIDIVLPQAAALRGTVTDARGRPVSDVHISMLYNGNEYLMDAHSDAQGHYLATGFPRGSYTVSFGVTPYSDRTSGSLGLGSVWYGGTPDQDGSTTVTLHTGSTATANQELPLLGALSGTVVNGAGKPLAGAGISVAAAGGTYLSGNAAADGTWTIDHIPAGDATVCFGSGTSPAGRFGATGDCFDHEGDGGQPDPVTVEPGHLTGSIDGTVTFLGGLTVELTDGSGDPLEGAEVDILDGSGQQVGTTNTDEYGQMAWSGLAAGRYSLQIYGYTAIGGPGDIYYGAAKTPPMSVSASRQSDFGIVVLPGA